MADDWINQNATKVSDEDWLAQNATARTTVAAHTRKKRSKFQQAAHTLLPGALATAGEYGGQVLGGLGAGIVAAPTGPGELAAIPAGVYGGRVAGAGMGAAGGKMLANTLSGDPLMEGVGQETALQTAMAAALIPAFSPVKGIKFSGAGANLGKGMTELVGKLSPEGAGVAIANGIKTTKAGLAVLERKIAQAGEFTDRLYGLATRRGVRYNMKEVVDAAKGEVMKGYAARGLKPTAPEYNALGKATGDFIDKHNTLVTPQELKVVLRDTRDKIGKVFTRMDKHKRLVQGSDVEEDKFFQAFTDEALKQLRKLPDTGMRKLNGQTIKHGVEDAEAYTSGLMTLRDEMVPVVAGRGSGAAEFLRRSAPKLGPMAGGAALGYYASPENRVMGALAGATAAGTLSNPAVAAKIAMFLNSPAALMGTGQVLRPAGSAVLDYFNQPQE